MKQEPWVYANAKKKEERTALRRGCPKEVLKTAKKEKKAEERKQKQAKANSVPVVYLALVVALMPHAYHPRIIAIRLSFS